MDDNSQINRIEKLVFLAQNGDSHAFGRIYDMFVDQIYRYVFIKVNDQMDAQDITSETFKRAWDNLDRYQKNNFRAYLYTIARNLAIDHIRKKSKSIELVEDVDIIDNKSDIEDRLIRKERIDKLHQAIKIIPDIYAEVIILRYIEDLSIKETARILNKSSISIRVIQHRAIKKLRKILI